MTRDAIYLLREKLGLSEADFASLIGVDTRSVRRWEAGEASPSGSSEGVLLGLEDAIRDVPEFKEVCRRAAPRGLAWFIYRLAVKRQP